MINDDVALGPGVKIFHPSLVNLYGCTIGAGTKVGAFVEFSAVLRLVTIARSLAILSFATVLKFRTEFLSVMG